MTLQIFHKTPGGVQRTVARWNKREDLGRWMAHYTKMTRGRYGFKAEMARVVTARGEVREEWRAV